MVTENNFDFAVSPGEILQEEMEARGMSQTDLAQRSGLSRKTINELVNAKCTLTAETALRLEKVFHQPVQYWLNLENSYRAHLARKEEHERLSKATGWASSFPLNNMSKYGWIEKKSEPSAQVSELLNFFGIGAVNQWDALWGSLCVNYRKSSKVKSSAHAISAWLRRGEIESERLNCGSFNRSKFVKALTEIRALTNIPDPSEFIPKLQTTCCESGVAVVFVRDPKMTGVSGATYWLNETAVIQLSLRYLADDHLWFTFFHEAGHILLHKKSERFLESKDIHGEKEDEANRFAARKLIPPSKYRSFVSSGHFNRDSVCSFSREVGVSPGIVVGRLQYDQYLNFKTPLNRLKVRYRWVES